MTKVIFFKRNVVAIAICLAGVFSANNVLAQDYVGTYSGTVTVIADVYLVGDIDNVNTEILNQELSVTSNWLGFRPNIPLYKDGGTVDIGLDNVTFESNGNFSAPERDYASGMRFIDISGNVSGNTINLTFRVLDVATGGTLLDATFTYIGTKQETGISEVSAESLLKVYPNPTSGQLFIGNEGLINESIEIFDVFGKKLSTFNLQQSNQIDISHLSAGIYFLQIEKRTVKIVKE